MYYERKEAEYLENIIAAAEVEEYEIEWDIYLTLAETGYFEEED